MNDTRAEFQISQDADGKRHAVSPELALTVLPDGESRIFHRNAIKKNTATGIHPSTFRISSP